MKRILVLIMVIGLVIGSVATADAAKKKKKKPRKPPAIEEPVKVERVVEVKYSCPCGISTPAAKRGFWLGPAGTRFGGDTLPTGSEDLYVKVEIRDDRGGAVYADIAQDTDSDNIAETAVGSVCGSGADPMAVPAPGTDIDFFIYFGTCPDGSSSMPTAGTVVLTFSNLP